MPKNPKLKIHLGGTTPKMEVELDKLRALKQARREKHESDISRMDEELISLRSKIWELQDKQEVNSEERVKVNEEMDEIGARRIEEKGTKDPVVLELRKRGYEVQQEYIRLRKMIRELFQEQRAIFSRKEKSTEKFEAYLQSIDRRIGRIWKKYTD